MKRVNVKELTRLLNEFITKNEGKCFTGTELQNELYKLGFNRWVASILMQHFKYEKVRTGRLYVLPEKPVYYGLVEASYDKIRKRIRHLKKENTPVQSLPQQPEPQILSTEQTISMLKAEGYKVMKPLRFDEESFRRDHPELYQEYLIYECI